MAFIGQLRDAKLRLIDDYQKKTSNKINTELASPEDLKKHAKMMKKPKTQSSKRN